MTAPTGARAVPSAEAAVSAAPGPTPADLLAFARRAAADSVLLAPLRAQLRARPDERSWIPLEGPGGAEAWVIGWPPGAETGWHDHGGSSGAFVTAAGLLREHSLALPLPTGGWNSLELLPDLDRELEAPAGRGRAFGPYHVHQMLNPSVGEHAISVHAYYPPLPLIRRYSRSGWVLGLEEIEVPEQW